MKLSGVTKMVKRQLVCNVFHNVASDDFYIGTASAIYCATGFPLPLNRSQMGALLGISEDTMIEKVVYNDFDCAYKSDLEGFNLDDNVKNEVEVKKMAVGIYYMAETHTGEQEEHERTFDNLPDEAEDEADDEKA